MDKFIFEKSVDSNVIKSVRFPEELNNIITTLLIGFVVSACKFALNHMDKK